MAVSAVAARSRAIARAVSSSLLGRGLLPTSRRATFVNRLPLVSGGLLSALPLHSAVASARLRSAIAPESQCWGLVPQDVLCLMMTVGVYIGGYVIPGNSMPL